MIAILGGTFDPFHNGHQAILDQLSRMPGISKIILVPAYISPLKSAPRLSAHARIEMLKLVIKAMKNVELCLFEIDRQVKTYTIETVDYIQSCYPEESLAFVIGSDNFFNLHQWKAPEDLFEKVKFIVITREKYNYSDYKDYLAAHFSKVQLETHFMIISIEPIPISSTDIRTRLAQKMEVSDLVPVVVGNYLASQEDPL